MKGQEIHEVGHVQVSNRWTLGESVGMYWDVKMIAFTKKRVDPLREFYLRDTEMGGVQ